MKKVKIKRRRFIRTLGYNQRKARRGTKKLRRAGTRRHPV